MMPSRLPLRLPLANVAGHSCVRACVRSSGRGVHAVLLAGGDFVKNNGSGGECVFPGKKGGFKDDAAGLKVKLGERGMLAMGNSGKNTNTSQFFITFGDVSRRSGAGSDS